MHTLTSGLDDYPRANPPHPGELHVDALAWVGGSAHALQQLAEYLRENADAAMYKKHLAAIKHNLDTLHWDEKEQAYCDATIDKGRYSRVCHQGYMSLFPLLTGLMDADHPNLPSVLNLLSDPSKLWSTHGLRSLSVGDAHYGKDEDYWRGAVWMNLNVLAVQRLRELGLQGPVNNVLVQARALSLAGDLRTRLVNTVFKSWERTGFIWEQYNDKTGEGSHSRAFTGWTACVILLMGLDLKGDPSSSSSWRPATGTVLFALGAVVVGVILCRRRLAVVGQQWHGRCRRARRRYEPIDLERRR
jgi:mannosyl-oligosaccharide glucosidase